MRSGNWFHLAAIAFGAVVRLSAQTPVAGWSTLYWDQQGLDRTMVSSYVYRIAIDGEARTPLPGVQCEPIAPFVEGVFTCWAKFPAMTPGPHVVTLTSSWGDDESKPSDSLSLTFIVVMTPVNLRLTK